MPIYINRNFENQLFELMSSMQAYNNARPVNLGGASGPGGGGGGPPGGFFGQLPQSRIAYDTSELNTWGLPASGWSILHNLNRIRHRISDLELVLSGGSASPLDVYWNNSPVSSNVTVINFEGSINVVETSPGQVTITITASGSGGLTGGGNGNYYFPIEHYTSTTSGIIENVVAGAIPDVDWQLLNQYPILQSGSINIYLYCDTASHQSSPQWVDYYIAIFNEDGDEYFNEGWKSISLAGNNKYSEVLHLAGPINVTPFDGLWFDAHHHVGSGTDGAYIYGVLITTSGIISGGSSPSQSNRQTIFTVAGDLSIVNNPLRIYNRLGSNQTISEVFLAVNTAPAGSGILVDIHKNGTTIFTNQSNRPTIISGAYTGNTTTVDVNTWSSNEYLTAHIDQIGSSTPGSDLVIHVIHK